MTSDASAAGIVAAIIAMAHQLHLRVVAGAGGVGTYLELVQPTPSGAQARLEALPLQSPGVCAYLALRGTARPPYLRFSLPPGGESCRLFIAPQVVVPEPGDGPWPARLLGPMDHARAVREGAEGQVLISSSYWPSRGGGSRSPRSASWHGGSPPTGVGSSACIGTA